MQKNLERTAVFGRPSNNLKIGIVGLPNVGKSTFFNVITKSAVPAGNYPFCTIDPEESRVAVPDERYDWLCEFYTPNSKVPAFLTVIDIAGLVQGASSGLGLGNAFLSHIKAVDAIFHVVRSFDDDSIAHVEGDVDVARDLDIVHSELRLKDMEFLSSHLEALKRARRGNESDRSKRTEQEVVEKALDMVNRGQDIRYGAWSEKEIQILNPFQLLTAKNVIYLANLSVEDYKRKKNRHLIRIKTWIDAKAPGSQLIPFSAKFESMVLDSEEIGALPKIIKAGYTGLELIRFFTAGNDEVRAWTIRRGTKAPQAAGVIHSDFEKGFIAAEVTRFEDLQECGSEGAVKSAGKYMLKGKDYIVEDGDVIFFKFNVSRPKK